MTKQLEKIFGFSIGMLLLTTKWVTAACIFSIKPQENYLFVTRNFIFFGYILTCGLIHLIIYRIGTEINEVTSNFNRQLFWSDWIGSDREHQQMTVIMCEIMKKPVSLDVAFFKNITLMKFINVSLRGFLN